MLTEAYLVRVELHLAPYQQVIEIHGRGGLAELEAQRDSRTP
jgi:hypothetical protein